MGTSGSPLFRYPAGAGASSDLHSFALGITKAAEKNEGRMSPDSRPPSILVVRRTSPCSMLVIACGVPRRVLKGIKQEPCQVRAKSMDAHPGMQATHA